MKPGSTRGSSARRERSIIEDISDICSDSALCTLRGMDAPKRGPADHQSKVALYSTIPQSSTRLHDPYEEKCPSDPASATPSPPQDALVIDLPSALSELAPLDGTMVDTSSPGSGASPLIKENASEDLNSSEGIPQPLDFTEEMFMNMVGGTKHGLNYMHKKKHRDPNEPQRPMSAYGMFFHDTQAVIKGQNPSASFGEVSKIVASMWDCVDEDQKNEYAKKAEAAKSEYLKARSEYRFRLAFNSGGDHPGIMHKSDSASSPTAMTPPREAPLSPVQTGNPLLTSAMGEGSPPHGYMTLPFPEDKLSSQQQRSSPQISSPSTLHHSHRHAEVQKHCRAQHVASGPVFVPVCKAALIPKPSSSLSSQAASSSGVKRNHRGQLTAGTGSRKRCTRNGCPNPSVESHEWDDEYCSSECVIAHCKDVFAAWVAQRKIGPKNPAM